MVSTRFGSHGFNKGTKVGRWNASLHSSDDDDSLSSLESNNSESVRSRTSTTTNRTGQRLPSSDMDILQHFLLLSLYYFYFVFLFIFHFFHRCDPNLKKISSPPRKKLKILPAPNIEYSPWHYTRHYQPMAQKYKNNKWIPCVGYLQRPGRKPSNSNKRKKATSVAAQFNGNESIPNEFDSESEALRYDRYLNIGVK